MNPSLPRQCLLKNDSSLLLREGQPEDARALLDYIERISGESDYLTFGPGETELSEEDEVAFLVRCRDTEGQLFLLALVEGAIVGCLSLSSSRRPRVWHSGEFGMSVSRSHWGQGIGCHLMEALLDWAREGGVLRKINLRVREDNVRAIALYERLGFVREGTLRKEIVLDGKTFDLYWMGLEI